MGAGSPVHTGVRGAEICRFDYNKHDITDGDRLQWDSAECVTNCVLLAYIDKMSQQRIEYKVALLTFKVRCASTPSYLRLLIQDREHDRNLRSTTTALCQPFTTTTFAKRAFRPMLCTSCLELTAANCMFSVAVVKLRLKTFLFSRAFSSFSAH